MRWRAIATTILVASMMSACGGGPSASPSVTSKGTPSEPRGTATPIPTATAAPCSAAGVLAQTDALLQGETFDAHYLTIAGQLTLSIWLMAPEIDVAATTTELAANNRKALERGLLTFARVVEQIPCTTRVFEQLNPMIVDTAYEAWYIDFLPARAFSGLESPTADEVIAALDRAGKSVADGREKPANQPKAPASGILCDFPAAKAAVQPDLGPVAGNTTAYLIIGGRLTQNRLQPNPPDDVDVEVQWTVGSAADAMDGSILERLGHIAKALACLRTPVDLLEAFVVDASGRLVVYAKVSGPVVRSGEIPLPRDGVVLDRQQPGRP